MRVNLKRARKSLFFEAMVVAFFATAAPAVSQQTVTYSYDELGRVSRVVYPDGKIIMYTYDATGNRTQQLIVNNQSPVAVSDYLYLDNNGGYSTVFDPRWNDTDPEGNALTITAKTNGSKGTVTIGGGGTTLTYVFTGSPPPTYSFDNDSFTYTISDGNGGTAVGSVDVTIYTTCPPLPPGAEYCQIE